MDDSGKAAIALDMRILNQSLDQVYSALTEVELIRHWLSVDVDMRESQLVVRFNAGTEAIVADVTLDPSEKKVTWSILEGHPAWKGVKGVITWQLRKSQRGCFVLFRHEGWDASNEILPSVSFKWARFMMSLKNYLQNGQGNPKP